MIRISSGGLRRRWSAGARQVASESAITAYDEARGVAPAISSGGLLWRWSTREERELGDRAAAIRV